MNHYDVTVTAEVRIPVHGGEQQAAIEAAKTLVASALRPFQIVSIGYHHVGEAPSVVSPVAATDSPTSAPAPRSEGASPTPSDPLRWEGTD